MVVVCGFACPLFRSNTVAGSLNKRLRMSPVELFLTEVEVGFAD